jgi:hypothetical protein
MADHEEYLKFVAGGIIKSTNMIVDFVTMAYGLIQKA